MKKVKLETVTRICTYLIFILCLLVYIVPLGMYDAEVYEYHVETGIFDIQRQYIAATTGVISIIVIISLCMLKVKNKIISSVVTLISSIFQLYLILAPYPMSKNILAIGDFEIVITSVIGRLLNVCHDLKVWEDRFAMNMMGTGIVFFALIAVLNIILIILSIIQMIKYIRSNRHMENAAEIKEHDNCHGNKLLRMIVIGINVCIGIIYSVCMIILCCISIDDFGIRINYMGILYTGNILQSHIIPILVFLILMCSMWIKEAKWIPVLIGYIALAYIVYVSMIYLYIYHIYSFFEAFIIEVLFGVSIGISSLFVVGAFITGICWLIEHIQEKKKGMMC